MNRKLLVIDTETTGLDPTVHGLASIALIVLHNGAIEEEYYTPIWDETALISESAFGLNGFTVERLKEEGVSQSQAAAEIVNLLHRHDMARGNVRCAAHNAAFDIPFLQRLFRLGGGNFKKWFGYRHLCTQTGALLLEQAGRIDLPGGSASLDNLCALWNIPRGRAHHALDDARSTVRVLNKMIWIVGGMPQGGH